MGCKDVKVEYIRVSRQGFNRNIMGCKAKDLLGEVVTINKI